MPGRGRGAARGRGGRGAGRGGRGGGRGRGRGRSAGRGRGAIANATNDISAAPAPEVEEPLDLEKDLQKYFVGTASFLQHYDAQVENRDRYLAGLLVMNQTGIEISQNARIRALAAAWARKDKDLSNSFLKLTDSFGLVEILKAVELLDSSRKIRVEEKKLIRLEHQTAAKLSARKRGKFKSTIDNLTVIKPKFGSASGAVCKRIRRWASTFTKDQLEFYALHYPATPWCKLADIVHFHPQKDFALDWFLPFCFGVPAPEETMVARCKSLTKGNVNILLEEFDIPFTHLKEFKSELTEKSKTKIAATDKLDKVLWNYEDLECKEVDHVIKARLEAGEKFDLPYGKLMERLLTIKMMRENIVSNYSTWYGRRNTEPEEDMEPTKACFFPLLVPTAQKQLEDIHLSLESPVVVIGDMSSSMNVAIRTSTIIASLLTAIASAKLVFFNDKNHDADFIPTNIEEILKMAVKVQACGSTAPAASLYPFYEKKQVIKTFIIVTDEEENGSFEGYRFKPLFDKYCEEVFPARLVFVSFLRTQHSEGQMVKEFNDDNKHVLQFKLDSSRPDLTKLDTLFGLLSAESSDFETEVMKYEALLKTDGLVKVIDDQQAKSSAIK